MCDCVSRLEKESQEKLLKRENEIGRNKDVEISEVSFINKYFYPHKVLYAQIEYMFSFKKANGYRTKPVKRKVDFVFSFCPFCGEKIEYK